MNSVVQEVRNDASKSPRERIDDVITPFFRNTYMWAHLESPTMLAWRIKDVLHRRAVAMRL